MIADYVEIPQKLAAARKENPSIYQTAEEIAYNNGKQHDIGSAAMYRPFKPKGSAHWVNSTFEADWSDTKNPERSGRKVTEPRQVAEEITKYWKALFQKKPTLAAAHEACLQTTRRLGQAIRL